MSIELLKKFITEAMMDQNIVRKDPAGTGKLVLRKLVTFKKGATRFHSGQDVDTELDADGNIVVDDIEQWQPTFDPPKRKKSKTYRRKHRRA
jgi:hypothetical protein